MTPRYLVAVWVALLVAVAAGPGAMFYANRVARQAEERANQEGIKNDLKWCSVVATLDRGYREQPPQTATGKALAAGVRDLLLSLNCPALPSD